MLGRVARTSGCLQRTSIFAGTLAAFVLALPSLPIPAMAANGRVVVPRATIYPGSAITEGMLGEVNLDRETDNFGQPLATREQVVGKVARRTLLPGQPIGLNSLRAPFAVVIWEDGGHRLHGCIADDHRPGARDAKWCGWRHDHGAKRRQQRDHTRQSHSGWCCRDRGLTMIGRLTSLLALLLFLACPAAAQTRIKDIASVQGIRANQLVGYGLIVGLNGTGDTLRNAPFTDRSMQAMLDEMGINIKKRLGENEKCRGRDRYCRVAPVRQQGGPASTSQYRRSATRPRSMAVRW